MSVPTHSSKLPRRQTHTKTWGGGNTTLSPTFCVRHPRAPPPQHHAPITTYFAIVYLVRYARRKAAAGGDDAQDVVRPAAFDGSSNALNVCHHCILLHRARGVTERGRQQITCAKNLVLRASPPSIGPCWVCTAYAQNAGADTAEYSRSC